MSEFLVRLATADDARQILYFIHQLAEYEERQNAVKMDYASLHFHMTRIPRPFECFIAEEQESGKPVGMALLFQTFSTWEGPGWRLEDFFVEELYRSQGVGTALWQHLLNIARERGYSRLEWSVLNWNVSANEFYRRRGANPIDGWTTWRLNLKG